MGEFIGTAGGLLMALLVVVLALRFMSETGLIHDTRELYSVLMPVFCTGLIELALAGLYYHMLSGGTSLLDIGTIWANAPLKCQQFWPFNWYVSLGTGVYFFWNLYQVFKKVAGKYWAEKIVYLVLAFPFVYYIFLPLMASIVLFLVSFMLRAAAYMAGDRYLKDIRKNIEGKYIEAGNIVCPVALAFLPVLSGAVIIINTKI